MLVLGGLNGTEQEEGWLTRGSRDTKIDRERHCCVYRFPCVEPWSAGSTPTLPETHGGLSLTPSRQMCVSVCHVFACMCFSTSIPGECSGHIYKGGLSMYSRMFTCVGCVCLTVPGPSWLVSVKLQMSARSCWRGPGSLKR